MSCPLPASWTAMPRAAELAEFGKEGYDRNGLG